MNGSGGCGTGHRGEGWMHNNKRRAGAGGLEQAVRKTIEREGMKDGNDWGGIVALYEINLTVQ